MISFPDKQTSLDGGGFGAVASWLCDGEGSSSPLFSAIDEALCAFAFRRDEPLTWWSNRLTDLTGRSDSNLVELCASDLVVASDRERFETGVQTALDEGEASFVAAFDTAERHVRFGDCRIVRLPENDLYFAVVTETSELTDHRKTLNRVDTIIYALDTELRFVYVNDPWYESAAEWGHDGSSVLGEHIWTLFPAATETRLYDEIDTALETQQPNRFEEYLPETEMWMETQVYPSADGVTVFARDITDEKNRQRELERYETIVETVDDGIYASDDSLRFRSVNEAMEELTGYCWDELVGEHVSFIADDEAVAEAIRQRERLLAGEIDVGKYEIPIRTADGEEVPVEIRFTALRVEDGEFEGTVGVMRDISERVERDRRLQIERDRVTAMFENSGDAIAYCEYDGETPMIRAVNAAFEESFGVSEEVVGRAIDEVVVPSEFQPEATDINHRTKRGEYIEREVRRETTDGVRDFFLRSIPIRPGESGERSYGVYTDITEQKERERELERYETIVETVSDGIYTTDEQFRFTSANDALVSMTGYSRDELLGSTPELITSEETLAETTRLRERILSGETETETTTINLRSVDGDEIPVELRFRPLPSDDASEGKGTVGVIRDITKRVERERALRENEERLRTVVENVPVILFAIDVDGTFTLSEGRGLSTFNADSEDAVGNSVFDWLADYPAVIDDIERALSGEPVDTIHEIRDGYFETWYQPIWDGNEMTGVIGVSMDVTARMRHEQALTALHTATQEMLEADSAEAIAKIAAEVGASVLDLPGVAVFLFDEETSVLRPVAHSDDVPELVGEPTSFEAGESITWQVFVTGETQVFDDVRESEHVYNPDTRLRSGLYVPLGNHGVFVSVDDRAATFEADAIELATIFAATTQAALDRVSRESALREREQELEQQTERLERLHETTELLRDIEHLLVLSDSRSNMVSEVCERLAETDRFAMSWIGRPDETASQVIPEAWAGTERGYLDSVSLTLDGDSETEDKGEPAAMAIQSGDLTAIENVADVAGVTAGLQSDDWRPEALMRGYQSVVAIPLVYRDYSYGVLAVYANRPDAFDALSREVFAELGETIAYAINAIETKRGLLTDQTVELDLRVHDSDDLLQRLAGNLDCQVAYEGVVAGNEDEDHLFITASMTDIEAVQSYLNGVVGVTNSRLVSERDENALFEVTVTEPLFASALVERGAVPESITASEESIRAVVNVPHTTEVREFVETLRARYPGLELAARRNRERPVQTVQTCRAAFEERLTDRQQQVLETAYLSGFFDSPRSTTGQEVAASLDITQPTFINHLRSAQRKLFDQLYEVDVLDS
ncbi:PAS domain S-box-containing protein [Haladaptatus litoreus]|uniref:PAS domain S-box-containing protein n=1 Tax=Haladaptatus litoreus TaxID=553468 RepID=A0A1N6VVG8_9EURY|nr:PAS domain S-box protein [Haladaptatus litoreus]SIQ81748.1 PAS domain S-box-containing protein [Haladaptatus litoreus]